MTEPAPVDSFGNAKFSEDFRSENQFHSGMNENTSQRHSTLKKKHSVKRKSVVEPVATGGEDYNSVLHTPIPTQSNPTEALVNRFQEWRRLLKDYIAYFREVQSTSEAQAKSLLKLSQAINNHSHASEAFLKSGGILETSVILQGFHKEASIAAEDAKIIETEIINHLTGVRGDLNLKVKEIKALSGDFRNNVEKERESTRKALAQLRGAIQTLEVNPQDACGKNEPYIVRLHAENQIRRQLAEENCLQKAYFNLEASGRELEKLVVGEVQKAFSKYAQIIRREGQCLVTAADSVETTNTQLPQDLEWSDFVKRDPNIIEPSIPLRKLEDIDYPGLHNTATAVVREGELERRTKYLKSFASGWYVLSATHLHEFKTPDRVNDVTPVMSLYLPDCTLSKHSDPAAVSHKFVLKGRQTGHMHSRHSWTFRAETHAKMLEWYEDIKKLTELSGSGREAFIASHSAEEATEQPEDPDDSALLENDEADEIPYSSSNYSFTPHGTTEISKRPELGRFPSDIRLERGMEEARRPSSSHSNRLDQDRYVLVSTNPNDPTNPRHHSRSSSAFSYDETHPYAQAMERNKEEVVPVMAEVSPEDERKITTRHEYGQNEQAFIDRRNSTARGIPSRKPTASYGVDPVTGQPDPSVYSSGNTGVVDWSQLIAENEARTRSSTLGRGPPSRKPTASYGYDPITELPDQHAGLVGPSNASIVTRDIRVPGDYPKEI